MTTDEMTTDAGPEREAHGAPGAVMPAARGGRARRPRRANRQHRMIFLGIELDAAARFLRSHRFHENLIVGGIALAALAAMAKENQARTMARLVAWDRRRKLRARRAASARQARAR